MKGARLCFYLGEPCHSVCPEHQRRNEHGQLSSFPGEMIFDSGWNFWKGLSFYEMRLLKIFENFGQRLRAYSLKVSLQLIEA